MHDDHSDIIPENPSFADDYIYHHPTQSSELTTSELYSIKRQSRERAIGKFYERYYTHQIYNTPEVFGNDELVNDINDLKSWESKNTPFAYFITASPELIEYSEIHELLQTLLSKKWMTHAIGCIEKESRYHLHIYVRAAEKIYSEVKREIKSTCERYCTKTNINIKKIRKEDEHKLINYCNGHSKKQKNPPLFIMKLGIFNEM